MARRGEGNDHTKSGSLRRREQHRIQNEMMMIIFELIALALKALNQLSCMGMSFEDNFTSSTNQPVNRSSIVIVSKTGGLSFKFRTGQIEHSVANGLSSLQHFFERSCVTWAN